ncbi:MAG: hypothetical protein IK990_07490 [Ruminiclostridium sp.]|nr:hypothetical protein [Ruminiclostridium sp.]
MAELDDILNMLGGAANGGEGGAGDGSGESGNSAGIFDGLDPGVLLTLLDVMSKLGEEDKNTELLKALRPLLREENRPKLDRAAQLMRFMNIIPLLRDIGLFRF